MQCRYASQLFWRGEKIHELGGRRLTKLAIIGYHVVRRPTHGRTTRLRPPWSFNPIKQGVHRDMIDTVVGSNRKMCGRVARVDISERIPERRICPDARLERFIRQHMLHGVGIRSKPDIVRVFKLFDLIELAQGFIPVAESDGIRHRDTIRSGKDQFAPADRRNTAGICRPVQLLQHRHRALDVAEDRLQPFFRSADPFDQQRLFEFPLFFELPHKRGCLPIEFQHWCHRIPLFM